MKRKAALLLAMLFSAAAISACGNNGGVGTNAGAQMPKDVQEPLEGYSVYRPKKITLMSDTCMEWEDGLQKVCDEYKAKTGIELEVTKTDHKTYYETVAKSFESGSPCDVIEMSGNNYPTYAANGALWDMTDAWASSKFNTEAVDQSYIDANKIDGKLYGFPLAKGKGSVTYIRSDILKKAGLSAPTNYAEFVNMLSVFKANGLIPYTSSGYMNADTPYNIYLPEFYWNANPDFIVKDGKYVDGMTEPEMRDALQRMRDLYAQGYFDPEMVTNNSAAIRDRINHGEVGCTNYWTGYGRKFDKEVKKIDPSFEVTAIPAIAEATYVKRQSINYVINNEYTGSDERKRGIFEYLIAYSHDGGEGELLFTKGAENDHWIRNEEGKLESIDAIKAFYDENSSFVNGYEEYENSATKDRDAADIAALEVKSAIAPIAKVTPDTASMIKEIADARRSAVTAIVTCEKTIDEGLEEYTAAVGDKVQTALASFNA